MKRRGSSALAPLACAFLLFFSSPFRTVLFQFTFCALCALPHAVRQLNANEVQTKMIRKKCFEWVAAVKAEIEMNGKRGMEEKSGGGTTSFRATCVFCRRRPGR